MDQKCTTPVMALLGVVVIAGLLPSCLKQTGDLASATKALPVKVTVIRIAPQPFLSTVAITGTLVSNSRVDVRSQTTGRLSHFPKQEGDSVWAGEAVAWVDDENCQLVLSQAEAAVQVAEASLEQARLLQSHSSIGPERGRNAGGITAKAQQTAFSMNRDARAQVDLAIAQRDQAMAALDVARKRLQDTAIRAPIAGEIRTKFLKPGSHVEPPTVVFTVTNTDRLELESPISSTELASIRPGQRVALSVNAFPGQSFDGSIIGINPAVEAETRAAKVRVAVKNAAAKLKAGMFVQGDAITGVEKLAVVVPSSAVYRSDRPAKELFVFVVDHDRAIRRVVRIGREQGSTLEIVEGLNPGDVLITNQNIELAEGVRVDPSW